MLIQPMSDKLGVMFSPSDGEGLVDIDTDQAISLFKDSGAVLFKGFHADVAQFDDFSGRFSNDYMDNKGSGSYRETVDLGHDGTIQNTAYVYGVDQQRTFALPLHADRSYVKSQPVILWFMCAHHAIGGGGETLACDGVKVAEGLSERTRDLFAEQRLMYVRNYTEEEWKLLYHTDDLTEVERYCTENDMRLTVNADRSIKTEYLKPAIVETNWGGHKSFCNSMLIVYWQEEGLKRTSSVVRLEDGSKIPPEIVRDIEEVSEACTAELPWWDGDMIMIDNTRVLHGRRAFTDQKRAVLIRMCRSVDW